MIVENLRALHACKRSNRAARCEIIRAVFILFAMLAAIPASTFAQETAMGKCPPETRKDVVSPGFAGSGFSWDCRYRSRRIPLVKFCVNPFGHTSTSIVLACVCATVRPERSTR